MRVCVATIVHHPNDARILHRQIRALLDAGHHVTYVAPFRDGNTAPPWPGIEVVDVPRARGRRRLRAVLAVMWRSVPLRRATLGTCLAEAAAGALPVAGALLAARLGHPARDVGVLVTAFGAGALAGSVVVALRPPRAGERALVPPKSKQSHRALALSAGTVSVLREQRRRQLEARMLAGTRWEETGHVFTSSVGTPFDASNVNSSRSPSRATWVRPASVTRRARASSRAT